MIVRRYEMEAKDGQRGALLRNLETLASWLMRRGGCSRIEIEHSLKQESVIIFSEYWRDEEARLAAGVDMNRDILGRVLASCANIADSRSVQMRVFQREAYAPGDRVEQSAVSRVRSGHP